MSNPTVALDPTKPTTFSAVFKHVSPPTAVDNCLFCNLLHPKFKNLVVVRGCFLDVYSLRTSHDGEKRLNWMSTSCVYDEVVDIVSVRFIGDKLDSLLISFAEAKVAVMGFDPIQYELKTLSLHNYEFENLKSGRIQFSRLPILRVDPLQRCAVLLVYDRHLAVLPFRRSESLAMIDKTSSKTAGNTKSAISWERRATAPLLSTFTTCLSTSTGEKITNVIDMQFLHGFYEPTLLVLYEPIGTWAGRVSARRDTCCIVALSFNLQKRTNPVIWFQESLPYDCMYVHAVPQPVGGLLILATNSIIYMKQTLPSCGLPLNCFAQTATNFPMRQEVPQCGPLTLDGCCTLSLTDSQFLLVTRTGKLCLLSLWVEQTTQSVSSLLLHEIGTAVPPRCLALLDPGYLFVGSRLCDSLVLRYTVSSMCVNTMGRIIVSEEAFQEQPLPDVPGFGDTDQDMRMEIGGGVTAERPVIANDSSVCMVKPSVPTTHGSYTFDEVDVELYGESILNPPSSSRVITTYSFEVSDRLVNFGPMGMLTAGEVPCLAPGNTDPTDEVLAAAQAELQHVELLACVPRSFETVSAPADSLRAGGVLMLHTSVRLRGLTAFELPEYVSLWSLYGPPVASIVANKETKRENILDDSTISQKRMRTEEVPNVDEDGCADVIVNDEVKTEAACEDGVATMVQPVGADTKDAPITNHVLSPDEAATQAAPDETVEPEPTVMGTSKISRIPEGQKCRGPTHSYLLLTREDSTMILEVGHEIVELEVSGFNTTEMTVAAVNLGDVYISKSHSFGEVTPLVEDIASPTPSVVQLNYVSTESSHLSQRKPRVGHDYPYILQVSPTSLRLLDGPKLIEYIQVTLEWRIHLASCADPYVLLCTEDDELFLIRLRTPQEVDASHPVPRIPSKKPSFLDLRALVDSSSSTTESSAPFASTAHLEVFRPKVGQVSAPLCFCLYHDRVGSFACWMWNQQAVSETHTSPSRPDSDNVPGGPTIGDNIGLFPEATMAAFAHMNDNTFPHLSTSDEEDLILYGELIELCKRELPELPPLHTDTMESDEPDTEWELASAKSRYFAFILFTNGVLEIYSLPDFTLLYEVHQFSDLPTMLVDHRGLNKNHAAGGGTNVNPPLTEEETISPTILEITVFPVGRNKDRPILMARTSQEVAFFEALCPPPGEAYASVATSRTVEGLRWRRLPIPCPLIAPRRIRSDPKIADVQSTLLNRTNMLRPFEDIDGHRGVFVCGACPMWLFSTDTGHIRVFTHSIDGIMGSFAPLNTTICPSGLVYFTYSNEMRLATLPPGYSFRENLGMRWIPLDITPYIVQYHIESKTYSVVGTRCSACSSVYHLNAEGNKEEEMTLRPPTAVLPTLDQYVLQMYAPSLSREGTWQPIPNTGIDFEPWEVVTCMITAQLASEQTFHGTKDYLALGANLSYGEEIPVRGRIIILDLIDVVPEPGQPLTRHKLKTIYDGEQKGPVTAMTSCQGHLISAIGQKVYIWTLKNGDLVGVAFVDSELYIHNLLCVKNLVLAADVLKSIQLLRFQSDLRVLSVVSRDNIPREVFTANFFVDGRRLGFLVVDEQSNAIIYSYDPLDPASRSGRRLVRRADLRFPSRVTCSLRVANRLRHALLSAKTSAHTPQAASSTTVGAASGESTDPTVGAAASGPGVLKVSSGSNPPSLPPSVNTDPERLKHSIYLGTQNGAIFLLNPLRDKMYSRLRITEKNLIHHFGPTCGMLPKLCWNYRPPHPELANPCGQVADADLLWRYLTLPHSQRLEIAKKSGQSLEGIMDDIAELNATTLHF
ncbi:unnamed protein product [Dicrocoelium dendriticum]|nr:unnamed protein product [Dicrocoelium dendriticum]